MVLGEAAPPAAMLEGGTLVRGVDSGMIILGEEEALAITRALGGVTSGAGMIMPVVVSMQIEAEAKLVGMVKLTSNEFRMEMAGWTIQLVSTKVQHQHEDIKPWGD